MRTLVLVPIFNQKRSFFILSTIYSVKNRTKASHRVLSQAEKDWVNNSLPWRLAVSFSFRDRVSTQYAEQEVQGHLNGYAACICKEHLVSLLASDGAEETNHIHALIACKSQKTPPLQHLKRWRHGNVVIDPYEDWRDREAVREYILSHNDFYPWISCSRKWKTCRKGRCPYHSGRASITDWM